MAQGTRRRIKIFALCFNSVCSQFDILLHKFANMCLRKYHYSFPKSSQSLPCQTPARCDWVVFVRRLFHFLSCSNFFLCFSFHILSLLFFPFSNAACVISPIGLFLFAGCFIFFFSRSNFFLCCVCDLPDWVADQSKQVFLEPTHPLFLSYKYSLQKLFPKKMAKDLEQF